MPAPTPTADRHLLRVGCTAALISAALWALLGYAVWYLAAKYW